MHVSCKKELIVKLLVATTVHTPEVFQGYGFPPCVLNVAVK
jgi:hypothetical protein